MVDQPARRAGSRASSFAIPTYFFIGDDVPDGRHRARPLPGGHARRRSPTRRRCTTAHASAPSTLFLVLHAFSSGTTALTGVEAISNGIPAFKEPRSRNAGITLLWMSGILGLAVPRHQLPGGADRRRAVRAGDGDLAARAHGLRRPRAALPRDDRRHHADPGDGRQHRLRRTSRAWRRCRPATASCRASSPTAAAGSSTRAGSWCWRSSASLLIVVFDASVTGLIPLYAIGVFLSFTLSQAGMARRWWKSGRLAPRRGDPRDAARSLQPRPALAAQDDRQRLGRR